MEIDRLLHRRRHARFRCEAPAADKERGSNRRGSDIPSTREGKMKMADVKTRTEETRQISSLTASGVPMKMLIRAEMSIEGKARQHSPGLIARLMGLETMPSPEPLHNFNTCSNELHKVHHGGFNVLEPECKDVFEVLETSETGNNKTSPVGRSLPHSRSTDLKEFTEHKFANKKCKSTHEKTKHFRELYDRAVNLPSKEDLLLRLSQEHDEELAKGLVMPDLFLSSPEATHITVLKSSNPRKFLNGELSRDCRKYENHSAMRRNTTNGREKPGYGLHNGSAMDPSVNTSPDLLKYRQKSDSSCLPMEPAVNTSPDLLKYRQKSDSSCLPTRIVVLKPSLGKVASANNSVPVMHSIKSSQPCHQKVKSIGNCKPLPENNEQQNFSFKNVVPRDKSKSGHDFRAKINERRKFTEKGHSEVKCDGIDGIQVENICRQQRKTSSVNMVPVSAPIHHFVEMENNNLSSCHPMKSFVSREAVRHLSKQWSMSNGHKDVGYVDQCLSTLAEMLALPDGSPSDNLLDLDPVDDCAFGIKSQDALKDIWPRKLARSKSLPASSTFLCCTSSPGNSYVGNYILNDVQSSLVSDCAEEMSSCQNYDVFPGYQDASRKKFLLDNHNKIGDMLSPGEIAATSDKIHATENCIGVLAQPVCIYDAVDSAENISSDNVNKKSCPRHRSNEVLQDANALMDNQWHNNSDIVLSKLSFSESLDCDSFCEPPPNLKAEPLNAPKDIEHASPVSVLDPLDEDDQSRPGCFQIVNSELQSLRLQLQLLRTESATTYIDVSDVLSDEEVSSTYDELERIPTTIPQFHWCADDQDFSYVLRLLMETGLQAISMDEIVDPCHLKQFPLDPNVFAKLEILYESSSWLRGERKLLFDLVNDIMAELSATGVHMPAWAQSGKLSRFVPEQQLCIEDVWISLSKRRLNSNCSLDESTMDLNWLNVAAEIETIARDLERMMRDELLNELVSEFLLKER